MPFLPPSPGRFFWKLFLVNAALMTVVLVVCVWTITGWFDRVRRQESWDYLHAQARALAVAACDQFSAPDVAALRSLAKEWGRVPTGVRVTFLAADGTVLGDSEASEETLGSHADRPEIQQALREGRGQSRRWSHSVARELEYVAVRVGGDSDTYGVVRVAMPSGYFAGRMQGMHRIIGISVAGWIVAATGLALGLALLWSRRIATITEAANRLARGDLRARARIGGRDEVALLGRSLNRMGERLMRQVDSSDRQRRMWESLLGQLREGVVVVDRAGRIVLANDEARRLLRLGPDRCDTSLVGCTIEECIPAHELQEMLRESHYEPLDAADSGESGEAIQRNAAQVRELKLRVGTAAGAVTVLARSFGITLPWGPAEDGARGPARWGRVLLLTDVTELTRVLQVKADFSANASHELRTPLAAIRAAVDTLRSIDRSRDEASAGHFIEMIARHSGRMEAMVADLLELSRLESPSARFEPAPMNPRELFEELRAAFAAELAEKQLQWEAVLPESCDEVVANPHLLGVVLRNLAENAIRFTDRGGRVRIALRIADGSAAFDVIDNGCGIPRAEQSRVFERFYQVQRARSGSDRGTGLGLSIVRHAVAAMNGAVELESEVGKGTRVTVTIPQPPRSSSSRVRGLTTGKT